MKNERKKLRKLLGKTTIAVAMIVLGVLVYKTYHMSLSLYRTGHVEELAIMLIGGIITGAIIGVIYMIIVTWKELILLE